MTKDSMKLVSSLKVSLFIRSTYVKFPYENALRGKYCACLV